MKTLEDKLALALMILVILLTMYSIYWKIKSKKTQETAKIEEIEQCMERLEIDMENLYFLVGQYVVENHHSESLSDSALRSLLDTVGAYYPEVIMAQYELESCKGSSPVYKRTNNLFGMKKAFKRQTCRNTTEAADGYAEYRNWQLSVLDRVLWDTSRWSEKPSKNDYIAALGRTYAEDPMYMEKLKLISKKYE